MAGQGRELGRALVLRTRVEFCPRGTGHCALPLSLFLSLPLLPPSLSPATISVTPPTPPPRLSRSERKLCPTSPAQFGQPLPSSPNQKTRGVGRGWSKGTRSTERGAKSHFCFPFFWGVLVTPRGRPKDSDTTPNASFLTGSHLAKPQRPAGRRFFLPSSGVSPSGGWMEQWPPLPRVRQRRTPPCLFAMILCGRSDDDGPAV